MLLLYICTICIAYCCSLLYGYTSEGGQGFFILSIPLMVDVVKWSYKGALGGVANTVKLGDQSQTQVGVHQGVHILWDHSLDAKH